MKSWFTKRTWIGVCIFILIVAMAMVLGTTLISNGVLRQKAGQEAYLLAVYGSASFASALFASWGKEKHLLKSLVEGTVCFCCILIFSVAAYEPFTWDAFALKSTLVIYSCSVIAGIAVPRKSKKKVPKYRRREVVKKEKQMVT